MIKEPLGVENIGQIQFHIESSELKHFFVGNKRKKVNSVDSFSLPKISHEVS